MREAIPLGLQNFQVLRELGQNIVETDTVPGEPAHASFISLARHNTPQETGTRGEFPAPTAQRSSSTVSRTTPKSPQVSSTQPKSTPSTSSSDSPSTPGRGEERQVIAAGPSREIDRQNDDYIGVCPSCRQLRLDLDRIFECEVVAGVIRPGPTSRAAVIRPGPASRVSARIAPDLNMNLISKVSAEKWNLDIESHTEAEGNATVDFVNGESARIMGTVSFNWNSHKSTLHQPPFTVHCAVCDYYQPLLVFGRPFLARKEHYWKLDGPETSKSGVA